MTMRHAERIGPLLACTLAPAVLTLAAAVAVLAPSAFRRLAFLAVFAVMCVTAVPAEAGSYESVMFSTPSKNIICNAYRYFGDTIGIRCDISSGLKPRPARPEGCNLDYGGTVQMRVNGLSRIGCVGDTNSGSKTSTLAYGKRVRFHGITCESSFAGLRCTNASGHGFFLSRAHSYLF
jgi:hypothetical protein